jgi:parallel beta-helix repeat protein
MQSIRVIGAAALTIIAICGAHAGSLNPPGAPSSTPGDEPRIPISGATTPGDSTAFHIIDEPGSYYLTGNISNPLLNSSRNGIFIAASNVTLDLNGFTLDGFEPFVIPLGATPETQGLAPETVGILADVDVESITIRNGFVRDWNSWGIDLSTAVGHRIEGVTAIHNGGGGVISGGRTLVTRCVANFNSGFGISVGGGSTVTECVAAENSASGISAGSHCSVVDCTSTNNGSSGITATSDCTISQCTAVRNGADGIRTSFGGCLILNNSCSENGQNSDIGAGVKSGSGDRVEGNNVTSNDRGIWATGGSFVFRNTAYSNTAENYAISGNNAVGEILSSSDPVTSSNPWANFSF